MTVKRTVVQSSENADLPSDNETAAGNNEVLRVQQETEPRECRPNRHQHQRHRHRRTTSYARSPDGQVIYKTRTAGHRRRRCRLEAQEEDPRVTSLVGWATQRDPRPG